MGDQAYDANRKQRLNTEEARLKMQQASYELEEAAKRVGILALKAVEAFLSNRASFVVNSDGACKSISFKMTEPNDGQ